MRMSRLIGVQKQNNDPLTFYDYMVANRPSGIYQSVEIPLDITTSDVRIVTTVGWIGEYASTSDSMLASQLGEANTRQAHGFGLVHYLDPQSYYPDQRFGYLEDRLTYASLGPDLEQNQWHQVTAVFNGSDTQLTIDGVQYPSVTGTYEDAGNPWKLFYSAPKSIGVCEILFYDLEDNALASLVPCVKRPGRYIGMYDRINDVFYPSYLGSDPQTLSSAVFTVGYFAEGGLNGE